MLEWCRINPVFYWVGLYTQMEEAYGQDGLTSCLLQQHNLGTSRQVGCGCIDLSAEPI